MVRGARRAPQTLTLGQRTLEDVFLELTGRELDTPPLSPPSPPPPRTTRHRAGTFTPAPGGAGLGRMVLAQARMEARLMLRNGEQLLLAIVIPVIVLVGVSPLRVASAAPSRGTRRSTSSPRACWLSP